MAAIALPNLVVWVVGAPLFVLVVLYKNRERLQEKDVQRYWLILYQGLRDKAFYWELVNTIRKTLVLCINNIMSIVSIRYRMMVAILLMIFIIRFQTWLSPYKHVKNNEIDLKAIIAGALVLY